MGRILDMDIIGRSAKVTTRLPPAVVEELDRQAKDAGVTRAWLIRRFVVAEMARRAQGAAS